MTRTVRRVVIFGSFDATRHPRVAVLEEGLRAGGHVVRRCNVPWRASTAERVAALRDPRVAVRLVGRLLRSWSALIRRARRMRGAEVVLVGYLGVLDVHLARILWPRAVLVLDHLAPVGGIVQDRLAGRRRARLGELLDAAARRSADVVVVDTEEHRGEPTDVVVAVGAPDVWFRERRPCPSESELAARPLRVVFFGLFTPLQGAVTIARAVRTALEGGAALDVTLAGHGQDLDAARAHLPPSAGVRWLPWVEPDELPTLVAAHDVCLGIMGTTPKAARVVPNKVFQGAAAGCALVTSDTQPQRRALDGVAHLVPAGDHVALAATLRALADDPPAVRTARLAAAAWADDLAGSARVVTPLLEVLDRR